MTYQTRADLPPAADLFEQARLLKVYDSAHRCYVPPVIGYWDTKGSTHCLGCATDPAGDWDLIHADNSAAEGDCCDFCGVSLLAEALRRADR